MPVLRCQHAGLKAGYNGHYKDTHKAPEGKLKISTEGYTRMASPNRLVHPFATVSIKE